MTTNLPIVHAIDAVVNAPALSLIRGGYLTVAPTPASVAELARKWRAIVLRGGGSRTRARAVDAHFSEDGRFQEFATKLPAPIQHARPNELAIVLHVRL
jgi:hypothetical protein